MDHHGAYHPNHPQDNSKILPPNAEEITLPELIEYIKTNNGEFFAAFMLLLDLIKAGSPGPQKIAKVIDFIKTIPGKTPPGCRVSEETFNQVDQILSSPDLKQIWSNYQ